MSENFNVEIISPDKLILKVETNEVIIPSYEGQIGILKDHIPLITFLRPGIIFINGENKQKKYFVEEGTIEFSNNNLLILTSTAQDFEELKKDKIEMIVKESQEKLNQKDVKDKEKYLLSYKIDTLKEIKQ